MNAPQRRFAQVDVFGDELGYGNPVAVVVDGDGLSDEDLQRFAHWTNLSETTFLLPPTRPGADYRVRIFTTSRELPFAGHPTLGSAHAWLETTGAEVRSRVVQECGVGLIELHRDAGRLAFAAPPLIRSGPLEEDILDRIVAMLGIERSEIIDHAWTVNGPEWAVVMLESAARVLALDPVARGPIDLGVVGLHPDGTPEVRGFVVEDGPCWEDPVTGSLNAGVAQWLLGSGRLTAPYTARQGTALGRSGRVHVDRDAGGRVWIGGRTRTVVGGAVRV
ncbi:MAG TPA: PhzF family phenazine biosynthesis protein [Solirubrobacteraceae bacterium]|nr:PhzF family phenazine biosynthesis protein [Solirubrobacteraceae bacterium]